MRRFRARYGVVAGLVVAGTLAAAVGVFALRSDDGVRAGRVTPRDSRAAQRLEAPLLEKILVLAPDGASERDLPPLADSHGPLNVTRVADAAAMKAALDSQTAIVMVTAASKDIADWAWLGERLTEGRMIVAININMGELLDLLYPATKSLLGPEGLGWERGAPGAWGPGDIPFVSILRVSSRCGGGTTGPFASANDLATMLKAMVECVDARFKVR